MYMYALYLLQEDRREGKGSEKMMRTLMYQ